jgi:threonylcarbamoyladenosine tRNA methylthiotransferase MtaB
VNTCAVTREAASDSRQKIRQAARNGHAQVVVTGCWSTIDPAAAAALPNVVKVVPNLDKDHLVAGVLQVPEELYDLEPLARKPLPGAHARTRAFIKVQDGCDNHCTFCVTRIARGPGRSRKTAAVIADIQAAVDGGTHEVVLSGVHLGSWGQDFSSPQHLRHLIEAILVQTNVERLRLSSLEPWDLDAAFFDLWSDPRLCRHLHLPLQSGSAATLRRMARKTTPVSFARLLEDARSVAPDLAITTDVISGFPGETEQEFAESLAFIREMEFAGGHVFTYSPRPGTAAAKLPNPVPKSIGKIRNAMLRRVFAEAEKTYAGQFVGQALDVLWESSVPLDADHWQLSGLTGNYLRVVSRAQNNLWNHLSSVRIQANTAEGLSGSILSE